MRYVFCSFLGLVLGGCTGIFSSDQKVGSLPGPRPQGNGAGYGLISDLQPLCALEANDGDTSRVACQVVKRTEEGEVPLLSLPEGIRIDWQPPVRVSGAEATVVAVRPSPDGLSFEADLRVTGTGTAQVRLEFVATPAQGEPRTKSQLVSLPFSVETYGQLTSLDSFFRAGSDASGEAELKLLSRWLAPAEMVLSLGLRQTQPVCRLRGTLYVAGPQNVYSLHEGRYRLFAGRLYGSSSGNQITDARKRAIGFYPALACFRGATPAEDRVFIASVPNRSPGLYRFTVTRLSPEGRGESWTSPEGMTVRNVAGAAVTADGTLYLYSADDDRPRIYAVSPEGAFSVAAEVRLPPGLTFASPSSLPDWNERFPGALALAPNGDFWITLARANAVLAVKRDGSSRPLTQTARSPDLNAPLGIAVHPSGDALVADHFNHRIARISAATGAVTTHLGGPRQAPLLGAGEVGADGISPKEPVGLLAFGNVLYLSYEPAEMEVSGHLAVIHQDTGGTPFTWRTLLGGPVPVLTEGTPLAAAASGTGGRFVGLLGKARYQGNSLCFVERAPWRLLCAVTDPQGVRRIREVVAGPRLSAAEARTLVAVDSRQGALSAVADFAPASGGVLYVAQHHPPLVHKVVWNGTSKRYERVTIAGTGERGNTSEAADALEADLLRPIAVTVHPSGAIYFSEYWDTGGGNDSRIRRLVPTPGGKYRLETVAGNGVRGAVQVGVPALQSPLHMTSDLGFDRQGRLVIAQNCAGSCGGLYRLSAEGLWERLAGGGASTAASGPALGMSLRPRLLAFGPGEEIYFVDGAFLLRRLHRPDADAPPRVETLRDRDVNAERCAGGAVAGTAGVNQVESRFRASLGAVCAGNPWGLAVLDRCQSQGYWEIALTENHAEDAVQSLLVVARRACR